jgi:hypothetical protein
MNMDEPTFRCGTSKAMNAVAAELNLLIQHWSQDWSYEVADPKDIDRYLELYIRTTDSDQKFVLMEIIIQALNDQDQEENFLKYWDQVKLMLERGFKLHEYTIYYWSCVDDDKEEHTWAITPGMREVWRGRSGD